MLDAIRRVHSGEALFALSILSKLVEHYVSVPSLVREPEDNSVHDFLTPGEREVLVLVASGLSNDEIIAELHVSKNAVKTHISNLLGRLHARDRAQLVIAAYTHVIASADRRP